MTGSIVPAVEKVEKRSGRSPLFALMNGAPTRFLRHYSLRMNFNKGKCQDSGTHVHPFIMNESLYRQAGACKKAGQVDTSHGPHELDRRTKKQIFRRK